MYWKDVNLFAYTHSGSTFLLNILLELNICIFRHNFRRFWIDREDSTFELNDHEKLDLGVWFPRFQIESRFAFTYNTRICWHHTYPSVEQFDQPMILMVRDLPDVLFSFYKRVGQNVSFHDFLQRPVSARDFGLFNLYPAYEWALYYDLISKLVRPSKLYIVRFEDIRADPVEQVKRVLDFLNVSADTGSINKAVDGSSFERVKVSTERWYREHPELRQGDWQAMRKGEIGEWQEVFGEEEMQNLQGLPDRVRQRLGYSVQSVEMPDSKKINIHSSAPSAKALVLGLKAAECLDGAEAKAAFLKAANLLDGDVELAIMVGKALACCQWVNALYGNETHFPLGASTLGILLDLSNHMIDNPLVLVAAVHGLATAGNFHHCNLLLEHAEALGNKNCWEIMEIGKAYLTLNDKQRARRTLSQAAGSASENELTALARFLAIQKAPLMAVQVSKRCGKSKGANLILVMLQELLKLYMPKVVSVSTARKLLAGKLSKLSTLCRKSYVLLHKGSN